MLLVGGLGLAVEGPSRVHIKCDDNQQGLCRISYTAETPGEYFVSIKFDDEHIVGSPFRAIISGKSETTQLEGSEKLWCMCLMGRLIFMTIELSNRKQTYSCFL